MGVRLDQRRAVDENDLVAQLQRLAGQTDDPLDEVAVRLLGILEDEHVAALDRPHRQQRALDAGSAIGPKMNLFTSR